MRWRLDLSVRLRALAALLCAIFAGPAFPAPAVALDIEFQGRPVKLDILALYDSRRERLPHLTRIHKFAEMPLNHLGYRVVYHDVNGRLPPVQSLGRYRGILTWFAEPLRRPDAVVGWLDQALSRGLKYVVLGEVAPPSGEALLVRTNRLLARVGLEDKGDYIDHIWRARVVEKDAEVIDFERPIDKVLPSFPVMVARGAEVDPHLVLEGPVGSTRAQSVVIATSPGGGFAAANHILYYEPNTDRVRWMLNPFQFFARAFGPERRPIPDVTTIAGRRLYFSHIDGDGWNNVSEIQGHRELQRRSAEVVEREAIVPFPDLPVSVGLIAGDIEGPLGGQEASAEIARRLFALPQVEVATHTYTHPFNWQFFESYDRGEEIRRIEQVQAPSLTLREQLSRRVLAMAGRQPATDRSDRYIAGSDDLPRTYLRRPFDLEQETAGALSVSSRLAPDGKPARLYLWSGDTTPFPAAIGAVRKAGARNLNGGDSRLDAAYPSVAYVPPLARPAGDERQIYAANSNENTYTNDWTGPYYGFMMLERTLANTENPRRLKPFNVYYHMYSGEKPAALAAVRRMLEMARADRVIPIHASQYAAMADDFFGVEAVQVNPLSWTIGRRGAVATVRFDDAQGLQLDAARSKGVLGASRHAGSLYVALDPAVEPATVTLREDGPAGAPAQRGEPGGPIATLVDSRWQLSGWQAESCGFRIKAQGFGTGDMSWQTRPRRGFRISAMRRDALLWQETRWADENGHLAFRAAADAREPLELRFACHD